MITSDWCKTVLKAPDPGSPRDALGRAWFLALAHSGVRTCELLNIRLSDLDLARGHLLIRGSKTYCDRVVFLTDALAVTCVRYCVECWGKAAGVRVSPQRLRHTLATQLINRGMPLASVAKLLGHRSLNTTRHYARLFEQTVKEQFVVAIAFIEGIAAEEWPQIASQQLGCVNHSTDLVEL